jgi:D-threo-aldose 1-dehydrogenase
MIKLPAVGVGCAALSITTAETGDDAVIALLLRAYESGIRYFDVAPLYGGGRGEELLGRALARMGKDVVVSTKVGYVGAMPYGGRQAPEDRCKDFSGAAIERGVEESLRRLKRDAIDILFLHDPTGDPVDIAMRAMPTLDRLYRQGLIKSIGVGTGHVATAKAALEHLPMHHLLLAGRYTLIDRSGAHIIDRCRDKGVRLIAGGVFNSGLLASDRPSDGGNFDYAPANPQTRAIAEAARHACALAGVSLKAAAAQFARRNLGVTTTLLGPRTIEELDELLALWTAHIPPSLWDYLDGSAHQGAVA